MSDSVHIVAVGARTPLGLTAESSAAAVRAGIRRLTHHPLFVDRMAEPVTVAGPGPRHRLGDGSPAHQD